MFSATSSFHSLRRATLLGLGALGLLAFNPSLTQAQATRSIDSAHGKISVPAQPARVIFLDEAALDTAIAIGIKPAGTVASRGRQGIADYLKDQAGSIPLVGTVREPNLEALLAQRPDLILAPAALPQNQYALLSKIAPTFVPKGESVGQWQERIRAYGEALGQTEKVESRIAALEARIQSLKGKVPQGTVISVVRWMPQGPMVMSSKIYAGQLLRALGLKNTALSDSIEKRPHSDVLSLENLGAIDGDFMFMAVLNEEGQATMDAAKKQAAFSRLKVVSAGKVATVDGHVWTSGTGLIAVERFLDDIEKTLVQ